MISEDEKKERFYWGGISDMFVVNGKLCYLKFFEADEPYRGAPTGIGLRWKLFPTRNGFHAIGKEITTPWGKHHWFRQWLEKYPKTDYVLSNEMALAPQSEEEAQWIYSIAPHPPRIVEYYRDKAVLESYVHFRRV